MSESFKIRVSENLVFAAAHFITYDGGRCEPLHGHNYRAVVEVEGALDDNQYVFDFIAMRKLAQEILDGLDHRMLLPTRNAYLSVEEGSQSVRVRYQDREWLFPRDNCVLLPIENTTAELLARHIAQRLLEDLRLKHDFEPAVLRVEIEESFGRSAGFERRKEIGGVS